MLKPQNDHELAEYVTDVVQTAGQLNRLVSEGMLYNACEALSKIEYAAHMGQARINKIVDMAG